MDDMDDMGGTSDIEEVLKYETIAVVGCSTNPEKDANKIPKYLKDNGYRVIPVNPFAKKILEQTAYPSLLDIPGDTKIDVVMIFRPSEDCPQVVDHAIKIGAKAVWMPLGIKNEGAAGKAREAGLKAVHENRTPEDTFLMLNLAVRPQWHPPYLP